MPPILKIGYTAVCNGSTHFRWLDCGLVLEEGEVPSTKVYILIHSGLFLSHSSALFSFGHGACVARHISPLTLPDEKVGGKFVIYLELYNTGLQLWVSYYQSPYLPQAILLKPFFHSFLPLLNLSSLVQICITFLSILRLFANNMDNEHMANFYTRHTFRLDPGRLHSWSTRFLERPTLWFEFQLQRLITMGRTLGQVI